jgi:hypothetical protein
MMNKDLREDIREGISLRDHFAGLAMQGILTTLSKTVNPDSVAQMAYNMADAMLAEREKRDG